MNTEMNTEMGADQGQEPSAESNPPRQERVMTSLGICFSPPPWSEQESASQRSSEQQPATTQQPFESSYF